MASKQFMVSLLHPTISKLQHTVNLPLPMASKLHTTASQLQPQLMVNKLLTTASPVQLQPTASQQLPPTCQMAAATVAISSPKPGQWSNTQPSSLDSIVKLQSISTPHVEAMATDTTHKPVSSKVIKPITMEALSHTYLLRLMDLELRRGVIAQSRAVQNMFAKRKCLKLISAKLILSHRM
jgi:hypothetical protein